MEIEVDAVLPAGPYLYWVDDDGEWLGATPYKENITAEEAEQIKVELRKKNQMQDKIDINTIRDLSLRVSAYKYASERLGDAPCQGCNKFNTPDGILDISRYSEFAECVDNLSCDAAKEYYEKYNNYVKQYLEEHECNNN